MIAFLKRNLLFQGLISGSRVETVEGFMFGVERIRGIASDACMIDDDTIFIAGGDATIRIYNWKEDRGCGFSCCSSWSLLFWFLMMLLSLKRHLFCFKQQHS